ncbi:acyl-CoA dehydrogenase [Legionella antarctica]|uniref:Acyl-CoA dehydrogenase n=1 Tax=Legionella antarctica TaxID=2708020 RepID=A0A6F8T245_9GAMM|nr:acyl-CoA dehydrogenase [Legionella antarctica]BCA94754.1 acyl-CoA dehydrogenase [Legionella antarctica]
MHRLRLYPQLEPGKKLDSLLGSAHDERNAISFKKIRDADEAEEYPEEMLQHLYSMRLQDYLVPKSQGGLLNNFEEMGFILRIISQRDLSLGLSFCMPFLGACPAWIAEQDYTVTLTKNLILDGKRIAMCLTEHGHGSDLLADECYATQQENDVLITGKKWLINHATKAQAYMVFASDDNRHKPRSYSFYMIDKGYLNQSNYRTYPKIRTHGVRGADMGAVEFNQIQVPIKTRIGKSGQGLEILLKVFNITRSVAPCLALGATDTALRIGMTFALERKLYRQSVFDIPHARTTLVNTFCNYLVAECCSILSLRTLNFYPEKSAFYSSICKYLVPTQCELILADLAKIIGARYYLRDEYYSGMFQKILRDVPLISFGDGNSLVNLHSILLQMNSVFGQVNNTCHPVTPDFFDLTQPPPDIALNNITLSCHKGDIAFSAFLKYMTAISIYFNDDSISSLLAELGKQINQLVTWIQSRTASLPYQEPYSWFEKAKKFCLLQALCSTVLFWYFNHKDSTSLFSKTSILTYILNHNLYSEQEISEELINEIAIELEYRTKNHKLYSVYPFETAAGKSDDLIQPVSVS